MKYGPHIHRPGADALLALARWPLVKSLGSTQPLVRAQELGIPIRILRDYRTDQASASAAVDILCGYDLSAVTHVQISCESARSGDVAWQKSVIAGLRARTHVKIVGFGFPTGNPTRVVDTPDGPAFPDWLAYVELFPLVDAVGLDEYFGVCVGDPLFDQWSPWTAERHVQVRAYLARQGVTLPPTIVLESGLDQVIPGVARSGWLLRQVSPAAMVATILAIDAIDARDEHMLGRCYYTVNASPDWADYEMSGLFPLLVPAGEPAQKIQETQEVQQVVVRDPPLLSVVRPSMNPIDFRQLPGSYDCWVENIRRFFSRYGILFDEDTVFQAGKGYHRPSGGEAADFPTFRRAVEALARSQGIVVGAPVKGRNNLQLVEIDDFTTLWACLNDPDRANCWTVAVGENNGDVNPNERWQHYVSLLQDTDNSDLVNWYDPASPWDGDAAQYTKAQLTRAIQDNWDPTIIGYALKVVTG